MDINTHTCTHTSIKLKPVLVNLVPQAPFVYMYTIQTSALQNIIHNIHMSFSKENSGYTVTESVFAVTGLTVGTNNNRWKEKFTPGPWPTSLVIIVPDYYKFNPQRNPTEPSIIMYPLIITNENIPNNPTLVSPVNIPQYELQMGQLPTTHIHPTKTCVKSIHVITLKVEYPVFATL